VVTAGGDDLVEKVWAALQAGAEVLVREPEIPKGIPLDRVILHARMPGALEVASALHLASDMDIAKARSQFLGPITVSAHDPAEAEKKRDLGADLCFLSPIFAARHGRPPRGTAGLEGHVALGGVGVAQVPACALARAAGIAALGAIWWAPEGVAAATGHFWAAIQNDQIISS
jgi:thiamine monophosphate synthase